MADPDNALVKAAQQRAGVPQLPLRVRAPRSERNARPVPAWQRGWRSAGSAAVAAAAGCATLAAAGGRRRCRGRSACRRCRPSATSSSQGRLAATNGSEGFSAGLRWQQQDDHASIDLTAPLGFGAAHIEQSADEPAAHHQQGADARQRRGQRCICAPRWVSSRRSASLRFWILGASDPATRAQESLDAQQRLAHLEQDGWQVDYERICPGAAAMAAAAPEHYARRRCDCGSSSTPGSCERADLVAGAGQAQPVSARHRAAAAMAITICRRCSSSSIAAIASALRCAPDGRIEPQRRHGRGRAGAGPGGARRPGAAAAHRRRRWAPTSRLLNIFRPAAAWAAAARMRPPCCWRSMRCGTAI